MVILSHELHFPRRTRSPPAVSLGPFVLCGRKSKGKEAMHACMYVCMQHAAVHADSVYLEYNTYICILLLLLRIYVCTTAVYFVTHTYIYMLLYYDVYFVYICLYVTDCCIYRCTVTSNLFSSVFVSSPSAVPGMCIYPVATFGPIAMYGSDFRAVGGMDDANSGRWGYEDTAFLHRVGWLGLAWVGSGRLGFSVTSRKAFVSRGREIY